MLPEQPLHHQRVAIRAQPGKMPHLGILREPRMRTRVRQRLEHVEAEKRVDGGVFRPQEYPHGDVGDRRGAGGVAAAAYGYRRGEYAGIAFEGVVGAKTSHGQTCYVDAICIHGHRRFQLTDKPHEQSHRFAGLGAEGHSLAVLGGRHVAPGLVFGALGRNDDRRVRQHILVGGEVHHPPLQLRVVVAPAFPRTMQEDHQRILPELVGIGEQQAIVEGVAVFGVFVIAEPGGLGLRKTGGAKAYKEEQAGFRLHVR